MIRKIGVMIAVLFMVVTFTLKSNAQQATSGIKPQGQGEGAQLRQEIESLRQQAEQIRSQLKQLKAQAEPLRKQLYSINEKIETNRQKLENLHEERLEQRQQQAPAPKKKR